MDLTPLLIRPSLDGAQLVGDRGFPLIVGTEATVKRESHGCFNGIAKHDGTDSMRFSAVLYNF